MVTHVHVKVFEIQMPEFAVQLEDDKNLAKRVRGSVNARVEKEKSMVIVKWYDNKSFTMISSFCATVPQDKALLWSKSDKAFVEVNSPHIVKAYSTFT